MMYQSWIKITIATSLVSLLSWLSCFGQYRNNQSAVDDFLSKGIYINNLDKTISWGMRYDSLYSQFKSDGVYKVYTKRHHYFLALDTTVIFNVKVAKVNLFARYKFKFKKQYSEDNLFSSLHATINANSLYLLKDFFEKETQKPGKRWGGADDYEYIFKTSNCIIMLWKSLRLNGYFLTIQNSDMYK